MSKLINEKILSIVHPELTGEWDFEKNYPLTPENVSYGSNKKVFWNCKKCDTIWNARISHRSGGSGCPKCAKHPPIKESILKVWPEVVKIWHPTKNELTPDIVSRGSDIRVWWKCNKNHEWEAPVYSVYTNNKKGNSGCPYCHGNKIDKNNCLANLFPEIAKEWHPTKNGDITPYDVGKGSAKRVWWKCEKGHEWKTSVGIKTAQKTGCPYCNNSKLSHENNLAVKNPEIALLWHPTKNGNVTPNMVTSKTHDVYWWQCKKGHEWKTRVGHLVSGVSSCPKCNRIRLKDGTDFLSLVEAFWYLTFKKFGFNIKCEEKYPGAKRSKYDFYFPDFNLYVEVTGYGKEWKYWERYKSNINKKKDYVEKILRANFQFVSYALKQKDLKLVHENIINN